MDCKYYEKCNAPLCPLDQASLEHGIWYPDEEICRLKEYSKHEWIINQKKIQKKTRNHDTYYTYEMLNRHIIIAPGIKGLDPDKDYKEELKKWLKAHPTFKKRKMSEEEKKQLRERLKRGLSLGKK